MIKFSLLSSCLLSAIAIGVMLPGAIAQPMPETVFEFEAMPAFEPMPTGAPIHGQTPGVLPGQITPDARPLQFVSQPFADVENLTLSESEKTVFNIRTVSEEANADAPKSESHHSGFTIRMQ